MIPDRKDAGARPGMGVSGDLATGFPFLLRGSPSASKPHENLMKYTSGDSP